MSSYVKAVCRWSAILAFVIVTTLSSGGSPAALASEWVVQDSVAEPGTADRWSTSLELALKKSAVSGKPVFVKFEAEWCASCQQLDKEFEKPPFQTIGSAAILVRIDIDKNPEVALDFNVQAVPMVVLLDSNSEVVAEKTGFAEVDQWVTWIEEAVKDTEFKMPDVLESNDPPTRTEIKELIENLASRDPAMRQITMERLTSFPSKTRVPLVDSLREPGRLAQKLSILEILHRWQAPIDGLDPWAKASFTEKRMNRLDQWKETPIENLAEVKAELSDTDLANAEQDIDNLLIARNVRAGLARLTRYGTPLLPTVYERIKQAKTDEAMQRLTALRYWLTASNELRLGWTAGLIELASPDLDGRRNAASALTQRATRLDQSLLLELFADSDPLVRELSLKGLQRIGAKETDAALARLLSDPDPNVRAAVLKQFAEAEATQMTGQVAKYLETETDVDLIVHALRFLKTAKGDNAIKAMLPFVSHESWQVRAEVAESLGKLDSDELSVDMVVKKGEAVMKLLEDGDGFVVSRAVKSLPESKTKKSLQNLTDIALRQPDIAKDIVDAITNRSSYSYSGNTVSVTPFLKQFIVHENAKVREAGITGLGINSAAELTDQEFVSMLKDDDRDVRMATIKAFFGRLQGFRSSVNENVGSDSQVEMIQPQQSSGLFGLFGFGGNKPPSIEVPDDASEQGEDSGTDDPNQPRLVAEPSEPAKSDEEKKQLRIPKLAEEEWLAEWLDGKVKIKLDDSIVEIKKLSTSSDSEEKLAALACRVVLGEQDSVLDEFLELAAQETAGKEWVLNLLTWLPFEKRNKLFKQLVAQTNSADQFDRLFTSFASVRNPDAANSIWEQAGVSAARPATLYNALLTANFGDSVSMYMPVTQTVQPDLVVQVTRQTEQFVESKEPTTQKLVLVMLQKLNLKEGKKVAKRWAVSADNKEVKDLAFRILLLPPVDPNQDPYGHSDRKEDRTHAVEYLKSDEAWKFATALRYLALGEDTLNESENTDDGLMLASGGFYYGFGGSGDGVKVRIPKPPKGMTLQHLDRDDLKLDDQAQALVTYFRSLLVPETDLTPLLNYWRDHKTDSDTSQLVYRAVASTNDNDLVYMVTDIYEQHGKNSESFSADLYWTIRVMDGKNAIRLRKRIRDEIGMSSLNNY